MVPFKYGIEKLRTRVGSEMSRPKTVQLDSWSLPAQHLREGDEANDEEEAERGEVVHSGSFRWVHYRPCDYCSS